MTSARNILFIDANIYLDLYRIGNAKKLLAALKEQKEHIFVTEQIVNEVKRNKVQVAVSFLENYFKELIVQKFNIPDHLLGNPGGAVTGNRGKSKEIHNQTKTLKKALEKQALDNLDKISQSKDEVSVALEKIFANAVNHDEDQLQRARLRKESGKAPGKKNDPLGDQLNWEQILSQLQGKSRLWIISGDGDFLTEYNKKVFLNAQLYEDLVILCHPAKPEVFCFNNILDAIKDFAKKTHVVAKKLPSDEDSEEIKKELASLTEWDQYNRQITPAGGVVSMVGYPPTVISWVPSPPDTDEES